MGKPKKKVKTLPTIKLSFDQTEMMINIIQKYPVLYDPTLTDYHHRTITFNAYERVAREMDVDNLDGKYIFIRFMLFILFQ